MTGWVPITQAAVSWGLAILGVPNAGIITGAISTGRAIGDTVSSRDRELQDFVLKSATDFNTLASHESSELAVEDRQSVHEWLESRLDQLDSEVAFGSILLGRDEFRRMIVTEQTPVVGWSDNHEGYRDSLITGIHGIALSFVQSPQVFAVAGTSAIRRVLSLTHELSHELTLRPTHAEMVTLVEERANVELSRRFILGSRPELTNDAVVRPEAERLRHVLDSDGTAVVCALQGMRGVGKTQLAADYAAECEEHGWRFIAWVDATSRDQVIADLSSMANFMRITEAQVPADAARHLIDHLNSRDDDRLLVFDNVDRLDDIHDFIPHGPGMRVIITTTITSGINGERVGIDVFNPEQAIDYLTSRTQLDDHAGASRLADLVGYLPLALTQSASAITGLACSYDEYCQELDNHPTTEVLYREDGSAYPHSVGAALLTAYRTALTRIGNSDTDTTTDHEAVALAERIVQAMTLMAETGVPRNWLLTIGNTPMQVRRCLKVLIERSILTESADRSVISIHRLQSRVIRDETHTDTSTAVEDIITVLNAAEIGNEQTYSVRVTQLSLLIDQLLAMHGQNQSADLLREPPMIPVINRALATSVELSQPRLGIALAPLVEVVDTTIGPADPRSLNNRSYLAGAYRAAGDVARALPMFKHVLNDRRRILGEDHPHTLTSLNNLAYAYRSIGDLTTALSIFKETLAYRERILGNDHPDTLTSRNNLAYAYRAIGHLSEAIALYEQTLADRERLLGDEHPDTLTSRNNLARAYRAAGDFDRAIRLHRRTVVDRERILGPDHPQTMASRNNLAYTYRAAGDPHSAIPLFEQTLDDRRRLLGDDHPHTLISMNSLARAYRSAGEFTRALALHKDSFETTRGILGPEHPQTLIARNDLARAYAANGDAEAAIELFQQNAEDRTRILGEDHPHTLQTQGNLAYELDKAGQNSDALQLVTEALTFAHDSLPGDHPRVNRLQSLRRRLGDGVD